MNRAQQIVLATTALLILTVDIACAGRQDPAAQNQNPPASQDQDAPAKAAARKKRFEETKKQLESQSPEPQAKAQSQPASKPSDKPAETKPGNVVFTMPVTMMVGETQRFLLYDNKRNNVTADARWTTNGAIVAELSVMDGVPNVVAKQAGLILLYGTYSDRTAEVQISVLAREQMNSSTIRWNEQSEDVDSPLKIVPAIPTHTPLR